VNGPPNKLVSLAAAFFHAPSYTAPPSWRDPGRYARSPAVRFAAVFPEILLARFRAFGTEVVADEPPFSNTGQLLPLTIRSSPKQSQQRSRMGGNKRARAEPGPTGARSVRSALCPAQLRNSLLRNEIRPKLRGRRDL
jgi:hypothetical protein